MLPARSTRWHRGQSASELGIFGSIMLVAVAGMLRFGLRYIYQQQVEQEAVRETLWRANESVGYRQYLDDQNYLGVDNRRNPAGQASVSIIRDHYIPDPSRPLAIGQRMSFSGAANVSWGNRSQLAVADWPAEFSDVIFRISGADGDHVEAFSPGKWIAYVAPATKFQWYARIFCDPHYDDSDDGDKARCHHMLHWASRSGDLEQLFVPTANGTWTVPVVGPNSVVSESPWSSPRKTIMVMDPCAGHLVSDASHCMQECNKFFHRHLPVPPYCTPAYHQCSEPGNPPPNCGDDVALDLTPDKPWHRKRWRWFRLWGDQGDFPTHGPDLNNQIRASHIGAKITTQSGSPTVQQIRRFESEHVTGRGFKVQDAGPPDRFGTYTQRTIPFESLSSMGSAVPATLAPPMSDINLNWETTEQDAHKQRTLPP